MNNWGLQRFSKNQDLTMEVFWPELLDSISNLTVQNYEDIKSFLRARNINKIFHFTYFNNLINIAQENQGLKPKSELTRTESNFIATDSTEVSYFRNFIHCSLSKPNIYMLRSKIGEKSRIALLEIAIEEVFRNPFIVFPTNSGKFGYEELYANNWKKTISIEGLVRAYSNNEIRNRFSLSDENTTCPQAELLFLNNISWKSVRKVSLVAHGNNRYIDPKWSDDFFRFFGHDDLEGKFGFVNVAEIETQVNWEYYNAIKTIGMEQWLGD